MKKRKNILLSTIPLMSVTIAAKCHNEENNNINNQKPPATKPIDPSETFEPRRPDVERTEPDNNENTNTKNVDFSDVQSLNKNLKITNYSYKKYDPKTAFAEIQKSENIFFKDVFDKQLIDNYALKIKPEFVKYDFDSGLLINLTISFTKQNVTKDFIFTVHGFKKAEQIINNINNQKPPATKPIDPSETFEPRRPDVERTEPDNNENTNTKNVDFSDVQSLNKNLKITNYSYKKYDPKTAFAEIQKSENIFFKDVFDKQLIDNYALKIKPEFVKYDFDSGLLINLTISFTKQNITKDFVFTVHGFKKAEQIINNKNKKENYISAKEPDEGIKNLYPSLIARMLLYIDNKELYSGIVNNNNTINYESLLNANGKYFSSETIPFGPGTKEALFKYNESLREEYIDKIIAAGYDDSAGTLQLEVEIKNNPEKDNAEPIITKTFSFASFKKVDLKNPDNNVIGFFLTTMSFKNLQVIKSIFSKTTKESIKAGQNILKDIDKNKADFLKQRIISELNAFISDNSNAYKDGFNQSIKVRDLASLSNNFLLYPFSTWIGSESIFDLKLELINNINS
ncbi:LppA family lipoprotein [Mycoplasmopsis bovis]